MTIERATGGTFNLDSRGAQPLTAALVRQHGYAMPFHSLPYIRPNAFLNRPALSITYRTDLELGRAIVPEPLVIKDPLVSLAFLYMEAPRIGDYYEFSQSISCFLGNEAVSRLGVEQAKTILREDSISLIDIALDWGFSSRAHFSNTFRRIVGVTPSEYRRASGWVDRIDRNPPHRRDVTTKAPGFSTGKRNGVGV
jgi:AraC-like DNA-binding protein